MHCYAAGFESWLKATPGLVQYSQSELVDIYGDQEDGGASESQILNLISDLDLAYTHWHQGATQLTEELVAAGLKKSHVVLIYKYNYVNSHAVVIYGVSHANGVAQISYMDPWVGSFKWANLSQFNGKPWLLAWKR